MIVVTTYDGTSIMQKGVPMSFWLQMMNRLSRQRRTVEIDSDSSINHDADQVPNVNRQLRKLWFEQAAGMARGSLPYVLLGAGLGLVAKRRYNMGAVVLAGFALQKVLAVWRPRPHKRKEDIELERYALRLERGDYGKFEVIPFK